MRQILLNLLSNAIKFGEGKPIKVGCKRTQTGGVQMEVTDEGVGIAQEDIAADLRGVRAGVRIEAAGHRPGAADFPPPSSAVGRLADGTFDPGDQGSVFRLTLPASLEDDLSPNSELSAATAA